MSIGIQKALIVEDNDCFRELIKIVLNSLGVTDIVEAANGRKAIEALKTFNPDLVIMDRTMVGMDGIECTGHIRSGAHGCNPATPIVMVSGHGGEDSIEDAVEAGVDVYLVKPISLKPLYTGILKALDRPQDRSICGSASSGVASCYA